MSGNIVCTVTTPLGVTYTVRRICRDNIAKVYIAFIEGPVEHAQLHRDAREMLEAMAMIGASIRGAEVTTRAFSDLIAGKPVSQ